MDTQLQNAYDEAVNQLRLHDVDIRIKADHKLFTREGIWGDVTARLDLDNGWVYAIRLQNPQPCITETLGHELYHVWEFENCVAAAESLCDVFGRNLAIAMGVELRCSICQRVISTREARDPRPLVCDDCLASSPELARTLGRELRCCKCKRIMTRLEAEESELGDEFDDELICDKCYEAL